jgi:toxin ParE1/3/4
MAKYDVQITEGALGDLDAIRLFMAAQRGEDSAEQWMTGFDDVINSLEQFPERGAVPPPLVDLGNDTFRQLAIGPYRILYEVIGSQVFVVLIVHTKRDYQSLLQERLLRP